MDLMNKKGQTALEYLLIVVVAIIVVVAVMVWMNATTSEAITTTTGQVNVALCRAVSCTADADCPVDLVAGAATCGTAATCVGTSNIGSTTIPGHCEPA